MNKALKEALRTIPKDQINLENSTLRGFKQSFAIEKVNAEIWLSMPRRFTRSATRFRLPTNTQNLSTLTPFEYLSRFVWVSSHRKHLYRFVFNKYLCEANEPLFDEVNHCDSYVENFEYGISTKDTSEKPASLYEIKPSLISFDDLSTAMCDVLGYCGPIEQVAEKILKIQEMVFTEKPIHSFIDFRSWCGLIAFSERYLNQQPFEEDSCDEVCKFKQG